MYQQYSIFFDLKVHTHSKVSHISQTSFNIHKSHQVFLFSRGKKQLKQIHNFKKCSMESVLHFFFCEIKPRGSVDKSLWQSQYQWLSLWTLQEGNPGGRQLTGRRCWCFLNVAGYSFSVRGVSTGIRYDKTLISCCFSKSDISISNVTI